MLTDAHCHPFDLAACFPGAEEERQRLGIICAASSSSLEEFAYVEQLGSVVPCFAVHPQLLGSGERGTGNGDNQVKEQLVVLEMLAREGRLAAVGETGFDLYSAAFRETEKLQDEVFALHLETALRYDLPLVIHVRRAMHKIFAHAAALKKCPAVVFHSWPGTAGEGQALLHRGINAFFSFGTTIMLNHREAMRCCALFPAGRLLSETDAPYQPLRTREYSSYGDLAQIVQTMETLRGETGMESIIEGNFKTAYCVH